LPNHRAADAIIRFVTSPAADAYGPTDTGAALETAAEARYYDCDYPAAATQYERAYLAYRREGDPTSAGRAARTLAWISGNVLGDWALRSGWLGRARTILTEVGEGGPEYGWVLIIDAFSEPDFGRREAWLREAINVGRRYADPDVEFLAQSYLGGLYVMTDRVAAGLALTDQALAALIAGELTELSAVDEIYCGLLWTCEMVNDIDRADQWMRAAAARGRRSNVVAAFCRAHYGGILTAAGRWPEAEAELTAAVRHFSEGMPVRRAAAIIRLANLRIRQGRLDEAGGLLLGFEWHPDAALTLAALHLARGEPAIARDCLERHTGRSNDEVPTVGESTLLGPLLAMLVDAQLEAGDITAATRAADRLREFARSQASAYVLAAAEFATGRVGLAAGRDDAHIHLQAALEGFGRAQLPLEGARARLELARALAERSPATAMASARAAWTEFERLCAARHAQQAVAVLRALGGRTPAGAAKGLTPREAEVLTLIGAGLSNIEIAGRLFISRRTVEHHVSSVLAKLGLRNRAEASAYAVKANLR
jgi:DNA-binding CsgD family transcriptional regulator